MIKILLYRNCYGYAKTVSTHLFLSAKELISFSFGILLLLLITSVFNGSVISDYHGVESPAFIPYNSNSYPTNELISIMNNWSDNNIVYPKPINATGIYLMYLSFHFLTLILFLSFIIIYLITNYYRSITMHRCLDY
jgi:hypothetical protein